MVNFISRKSFVDPTIKIIGHYLLMAVFIVLGTIFYANYDNFDYSIGFYYAVGIASGLGFEYSSETGDSPVFTCFFMLISVILLEVIMVYTAKLALSKSSHWYDSAYSRFVLAKLNPANSSSCWQSVSFLVEEYAGLLTLFVLGCLLVVIGVIGAIYLENYDVMDAFFLVISTMTTVGITSIPDSSSDSVYVLFAVYALVSVIVWGGFVLGISELLLAENETQEVEVVSQDPVHATEFDLLRKAGMHLNVGVGAMPRSVDRNEFFVMMVARLGLLEFDGIQAIYQEFDRLDSERSGLVPVASISAKSVSPNASPKLRFGQGSVGAVVGSGDTESSSLLGRGDVSHEIR